VFPPLPFGFRLAPGRVGDAGAGPTRRGHRTANSGKSTLPSCLAGLDVADEGTILVEGTDLSRVTAQVRAPVRVRSIGVMFQSGNLLSHLTLTQNVQLAPRLVGGDHRWVCGTCLPNSGSLTGPWPTPRS
jgi:ABC-type uncharacterized transport system YnjBCD ATPase subunit